MHIITYNNKFTKIKKIIFIVIYIMFYNRDDDQTRILAERENKNSDMGEKSFNSTIPVK